MRIDKAQVLDILRGLGKDTGNAERDLPDQVDTDEHSDLLGRFGISGSELLSQFGGGPADREDGLQIQDEGEARQDDDGSGSAGDVAGTLGGLRGGNSFLGGTGH